MATGLKVIYSPDPVTLDWRQRVEATGGSCAQAFRVVDRYVKRCRAESLWDTLSNNGLILPFATDGFTGVFVPLVAPSGVNPVAINFVSGDYSLSTGINPGLGNNSKYVETNYLPSSYLSNASGQISVYVRSNRQPTRISTGAPSLVSCFNAFDSTMFLRTRLPHLSNASIVRVHSASSEINNTGIATAGLTSAIRSGAFSLGLYHNGSLVASNSGDGGTPPNRSLWVYNSHSSNPGPNWDDRIISFVYIGNGIPPALEAAHYNIVQELQSSLGRAV